MAPGFTSFTVGQHVLICKPAPPPWKTGTPHWVLPGGDQGQGVMRDRGRQENQRPRPASISHLCIHLSTRPFTLPPFLPSFLLFFLPSSIHPFEDSENLMYSRPSMLYSQDREIDKTQKQLRPHKAYIHFRETGIQKVVTDEE